MDPARAARLAALHPLRYPVPPCTSMWLQPAEACCRLRGRAGERDDRDVHEGLLASISRARRSPLVSRCRATCRSCCAHRAFERQCGCSLQRHAVACAVARANGMIETLTKVFSLRFARAPLASRVALQADVHILLSSSSLLRAHHSNAAAARRGKQSPGWCAFHTGGCYRRFHRHPSPSVAPPHRRIRHPRRRH